LPLGKLVLLGGDPEQGKTWVALAIAAAHSQGYWPFTVEGKPSLKKAGQTLYFASEDGIADTLVPRLHTLGANLARIAFVEGKKDWKETPSRLLLDDATVLTRTITDTDARLCIFDPLQAFLPPKAEMNKMETISPLVRGLKKIAEETRCTIMLLGHLNKSKQETIAYKFLGSIDWYAAARSALMILKDPEDPTKRVFYQIKNSLAPKPPGIGFFLGPEPKPFSWGIATETTAEDMASGTVKKQTKTTLAVHFLKEFLAAGERRSTEILEAAAEFGIRKDACYKAKAELGVKATKVGFDKDSAWYWALPVKIGA